LIRNLHLAALLAVALAGASIASTQTPPKNIVNAGKYQIELRVPDEGIFAGEQIDVEFRLSDTTEDDPIEGKRGVPNANPTASVTMPAMPGMPVMRPRIHSEGVPGDYGIELFFPHGGGYQVQVVATPPGAKPVKATFLVNVHDATARKGVKVSKPFAVETIGFPDHAKAGRQISLRLAIKDTKTGARVRQFDVSHTKLLHLMIVSKDLGWFVHEHPVPHPDGTFTLDQTFPAGGDYLVFADAAPKDKGSQVISTSVHIEGPRAAWPTKLTLTHGPVESGGIVADFRPLENPLPVGKSTVVAFRLTDRKSGKPIADLEPYLGASGHLMIIHQDGQVFVHSHPAEDAEATKRLKQGEVRFTARFPKPGMYKAWVQFQRHGKVVTLPFVFKVNKST